MLQCKVADQGEQKVGQQYCLLPTKVHLLSAVPNVGFKSACPATRSYHQVNCEAGFCLPETYSTGNEYVMQHWQQSVVRRSNVLVSGHLACNDA